MKRTIAFMLTAVCVVSFCACGSADANNEAEASAKPVGTQEPVEVSVFVDTPYCRLKLPEHIAENVTYEVRADKPYTLTFKSKADQTELFSLVFNGTGKTLLGTIIGKDENTVIYMDIFDLSRDEKNYETNCALQLAVNNIRDGLLSDYDFVPEEDVPWEDTSTFEIETSVAVLKYPNKWKDKVQIEVSEKTVKFSDNGTPLFDLIFADCDGSLLGTYKDTPIYIMDYPVESKEQMAMQADVNVILHYLMNDPDFSING